MQIHIFNFVTTHILMGGPDYDEQWARSLRDFEDYIDLLNLPSKEWLKHKEEEEDREFVSGSQEF
jgi:hypothetical protein